VTVALIDSGVVPVEGLTMPGKIINRPDLSFESQAENLRRVDTFGHGTHLAGIITGSNTGDPTPSAYPEDTTTFLDVAPGVSILSIKVADHEGAVDVSQVIAGIDWDEQVTLRAIGSEREVDHVDGSVVERRQLERRQLILEVLVRQQPERRFLVGRFLVGRILVGRILVGRILVGRILVGRILVGPSVVRTEPALSESVENP
jgi:hypothetical protein